MDKNNNPAPGKEGSTQEASEIYNRPGSTEHNDYRIGGKEDLSADKKKEKDKEATLDDGQ